ncbi:Por secretion system C-terminal sorting domain-containing protein [Aquimarina amphilecti]|uniref:Por secretion system C-terminal sorting domain-containing protein n=1 Tax=Aquimarina amphilecti TaxID=1038014 RepID=A0A1H7HGL6_AQUAM|nr:carbohydrate-binding protein [Aquimarina amphilecti]SEK49536.1 Por secretion system C-terminal sorting domain-containing protein [Aquimarina amphilecti]
MKISNYSFSIIFGIFLLFTNTSKAQILVSHDFDNGNLGPFNVCTTQNPNYSKVVNGRLKTWWTSEGYNGTRMDKGAEACGDQWTTYKEGWYGMNLELGSDYPKNKKAGIAQIFGFIPGFWSWESMLQVENGDLTIIHRSNGGSSSNVEEVVYSNFPYETEVPIVIHFILSNQNKGEFEIWVNGVSEYRKSNINFGFGNFDSNDVKIGNADQDFGSESAGSLTVLKMGQYNFQDTEYETNETRTVYYDNVSWYNGPNGYDIVNPSEDTVELCESHDAFSQIEAEDFCEQSGIQTGTTNSFVGWVNNGDWVHYENIDFGSGANSIEMSVSSGTSGGTIEVRQGSVSGTLLGIVEVTNTGSFTSWETLTASISEISEKQDIYFVFNGGSGYLLDVDWFKFSKDTTNNVCNSPLTDVTPPSNLASGINYSYYEGNWNSLPNFNSLSSISTGIASAIDLSNTQSQDNFGLTFDGYINVPSNGSYTFYTTSDDGSTLLIDGIIVVDNDGLHGEREESGTVCLEAGYHEIEVQFFERTGGNVLSVAYEGPGISKQNVPTYYGATNNTITIQEDETGFCFANGTVDNNHTGHTGTGFINTDNVYGNGIDWKINGSAGAYTIIWRYASTSNRSAKLVVDGSTVASNINFNTTGSWTTWETESITVNLSDGIKDIRLEATNNSGLGNIDYMQVTGPNVSALACTTIGEDCSDFFGGLSITQTNPGCSNNNGQIIVNFEDSDVYTQIQLSIDGGNSYPITVNDNTGSYSFTGLSNAEYQVAARYAGGDCEYNVAHLILIQDCGDIPLNPGGVSWHDSYEANGFCWCSTNFDHNLGSKKVIVNGTQYSVVDICDELEKHPLFRSRNNGDNIYNDVQCGNGPINDSSDEPLCPGRVDMGVEGCLLRGVHWDMEWLASRDRFKENNKLPENIAKEAPLVYPNPVKSDGLLNINVSGLGLARVEIYSLAGLRIHSENINGKSMSIDLQHLNTGVYIVKILDNKQSYFSKISVQK